MTGHLHLVCGLDAGGRSSLREQSFCAPFHLSKPHVDAGALVVNVVNPTAGLFAGDSVHLRCHVRSGSSMVLTTPAAGRVFKATREAPAVVRQELHVESGGLLEYFPEQFIPHRGARYAQETALHAAAGAQLLFFEWLTPGRVASGEVFGYRSLQWDTDLWHGGALAARERYLLQPGDHSLCALTALHPAAHYLGCLLTGVDEFPAEAVEALHGEGVYVGWSPLATCGAWTVKALCADSLGARRTMAGLRGVFYHALGREPAALRRF